VTPQVVVLEDAHRAGAELLRIAAHLARTARAGVMLVLTLRDDEIPAGEAAEALEALLAVDGTRLLRLEPLDTDGIGHVVEGLLGTTNFPPALARVLQRATGGLPLACETIVHDLVERRLLRIGDEGGWTLAVARVEDLPLPGRLRDVMDARLAALPRTELRVLRLCAISTGDVPVAWLEQATRLGQDALAERVHALERRALVTVTDTGIRPAHDLVARAVVEGMTRRARKAAHRALADTIASCERDEARPEELGLHLVEAGDPAAALPLLEQGASEARDAGRW
jgi:predicted ATPase